MKVGTDGVLLGAWADIEGCRSILDIGTGTGIIALMAAQRAAEAIVTGIEIDAEAAEQARENAARSPFAKRVHIVTADFIAFAEQSPKKHFDALLCNPPYFADALKCPDAARRTARHDDTLSLDALSRCAAQLLTAEGTLSVVLPFDRRADMIAAAAERQLFPCRETRILTLPHKAPKRILMSFSPNATGCTPNELCIDAAPGQPTNEYKNLVKNFYLKF